MQVVQLSQYGDEEVLEVVDQATPEPVPGRVRVRVTARSVNPADLGGRAGAFAAFTPGLTFPAVLGWDFAGTLLDDAPAVPDVAPDGVLAAGTRVAGFVPWFGEAAGAGTYAEVIVVDPAWVAPVPDGVTDAEAAVLGINVALGFRPAGIDAEWQRAG